MPGAFSIIIPAYNEAPRIGKVLEAATSCREAREVIVVDDGSSDGTSEVASRFPKVKVVRFERNRGKGAAMKAGAREAQSEIVVYIDADLVGLTPEHISALAAPVVKGEADMTLGIFGGGRAATDLAQRISPGITGQRACHRKTILEIEDAEFVGFGIDIVLTRHAQARGLRVQHVRMADLTQVMKEEKLGLVRGFAYRLRMYWQIIRGMFFRWARR